MGWMSWIPSIIEGIGLLKDKDNASSPTPVEPLDLEALARLMTMNTKSPWGGMTYSQDDDGRYTAEYSLGETQPIFDRAVDRSLNPDQAYQMPDELRQLQSALMQQRLGNIGATSSVAPRPERRQYAPGGGPFQGPFAPAAGSESTPPPAIQFGSEGNYGRTGEGGYAGARDAGYAPGLGPMGGSGFSINNYLNRSIPGAQQGWNPSEGQQWGLENAGNLGHALSAATGIPGLGTLGNAWANNHMQNNPWQSPADVPQTGNDMINEAVDGLSSRSGESGRGGGRGQLSGPAFGGGGGWYYDSSGQLKFARSGHVRRSSD